MTVKQFDNFEIVPVGDKFELYKRVKCNYSNHMYKEYIITLGTREACETFIIAEDSWNLK